MKRKGLLFVATLILSVFSLCFVACGEQPHVHDYKLEKSETMHWLKCDCGDTKDFNVHSGGTATCEEKAICKDCSQGYGNFVEHTPDASGFCSDCELPMTATEGLIIDTSSDGTYAEVVGYSGSSRKVNIPSTYNNLPVKSIYKNVFEDSNITKVIIPNSVTSIGNWAFESCHSLTTIEIPNSVTSIGAYAFYDCGSLTSVNYIGTIDQWVQIKFSNFFSNHHYFS